MIFLLKTEQWNKEISVINYIKKEIFCKTILLNCWLYNKSISWKSNHILKIKTNTLEQFHDSNMMVKV